MSQHGWPGCSRAAAEITLLPSAKVWRVFAALTLLTTADGFVSTLASPFLRSLGYPVESIGILLTGYAVASLIARWPAGRMADGRHARVAFNIACVTYALALASYPFAVEGWSFWVVRSVHGLSIGAATTLNFASFLVATTQSGNRTRATALYTAAMAGGYSIGNFASGFLADHFGFSIAFWFSSITPLLSLVVMLGVPAAPPIIRKPRAAGIGRLDVLKRPDVLAIPVLGFAVNFAHQTLNTLFPLYVLGVGQTLALAGTARGVQSLTNLLARPFGDVLFRIFGVIGLAVFGLTFIAVGVVSIPFLSAPALLLAIFVIIGIGRGGAVVANAMTTVELSERGVLNRGTASALITAGQDGAAIVAPAISGAVAAHIGIGPSMQVLAVVSSTIGILMMLVTRSAYATVGKESTVERLPVRVSSGPSR